MRQPPARRHEEPSTIRGEAHFPCSGCATVYPPAIGAWRCTAPALANTKIRSGSLHRNARRGARLRGRRPAHRSRYLSQNIITSAAARRHSTPTTEELPGPTTKSLGTAPNPDQPGICNRPLKRSERRRPGQSHCQGVVSGPGISREVVSASMFWRAQARLLRPAREISCGAARWISH